MLTSALGSLCGTAVAEAVTESDLDLLLGATTLAAALNRVVNVVEVDAHILPAVLESLPARPDLVLGPLALTLTAPMCTGGWPPPTPPPTNPTWPAR